jgi:hypothetical protein
MIVRSRCIDWDVCSGLRGDAVARAYCIGTNAQLALIPRGTQFDIIMVAGVGINNTVHGWGARLLKWNGKIVDSVEHNRVLNYLTYYTGDSPRLLCGCVLLDFVVR